MPTSCGECGASLPEKARFCLECGAAVGNAASATASGGQSVSVGRDVGGDALTAGRDVHIHGQGDGRQLRTCRACTGTGFGPPVACPDCGGSGYIGVWSFKGCVRCGGKNKSVNKLMAKGRGGRGTGVVTPACSTCQGIGEVRV